MPKSLVLGNGNILVGIDEHGRVKDFYYDHVGLSNQLTEEAVNKVGVWVDGEFRWCDSPGWNIVIDYQKETMVGSTVIAHSGLEIELHFQDIVYNEKNIFIRRITVKNKAKNKRDIRVFLNHQFRMYGIKKGDTVYYDPEDKTIVQYKGRRVIVMSGECEGEGFSDYTVGLSNIEGYEGTWRDAEDGELSKHPIEHGIVDSTIGFSKVVDAGGQFVMTAWVSIGKSLERAKALHEYILRKTPGHLLESTTDYWNAWVNKNNYSFFELSEREIDIFKKSLLVVRAHVDNHGGIIASSDSDMLQYGRDHYNYVWHRDGAFSAMAMDKAGYHDVARRFYSFSADVLTEDGYFFHKYRPDRSRGSSWHPWITREGERRLPIQEDETALVLVALWDHYTYTKDLEYIETLYNPLIRKAGLFIVGFRDQSQLPLPTYDLWEEKWGIHTFSVASVYGSLVAASNFAKLLGKEFDHNMFKQGAEQVKKAALEYLYNDKESYFHKFVDRQGETMVHDETVDASSFYGMLRFGLLSADDKRMRASFDTLLKKLLCSGHVGGIARYEGDIYYRVGSDIPGNPWIITTLWLARYYISIAKSKEDMAPAKKWIKWVADRATPSGLLPEQVNPFTGEQVSASPLTWSHAEYVATIIAYLERLEALGVCSVCYPIEKEI